MDPTTRVAFVESECAILRKAIDTMANVVAEEMENLKREISHKVEVDLNQMTEAV